MKQELSVGVIGAGFVGGAVAAGFKRVTQVAVHDADPKRSHAMFADAAEQDVVFVCVPTPTHDATGACDLSILDDVIDRLGDLQARGAAVGVVVIKSTVPPGTVIDYCGRYSTLRFVSNPEFLTERRAEEDFLHPTSIVIGVQDGTAGVNYANIMASLYGSLIDAPMLRVTHDEAAVIKYARNCFFSVKVMFCNELAELCRATGAQYECVRKGLIASGWVNPMHTLVPGPDGQLGFGGKCFPKDTRAFHRYADGQGVDMKVLAATIAKNLQLREQRDWEHIPGALS